MNRISVLSVGCLAALAMCVTTASASAATNANGCTHAGALVVPAAKGAKGAKAKANIQLENGYCSANLPALPVIGTVAFVRKGNTVKLKVSLKKGKPNTAYKVQLAGNGCIEIGEVAAFTTNAKGVGKASGSIAVPAEDTEFFADVDTEGFHSPFENEGDTPYVSLP